MVGCLIALLSIRLATERDRIRNARQEKKEYPPKPVLTVAAVAEEGVIAMGTVADRQCPAIVPARSLMEMGQMNAFGRCWRTWRWLIWHTYPGVWWPNHRHMVLWPRAE